MEQSPPTTNWPLAFNAVAQVVTWLLVITGWVIINYQHNKRETRKEVRAQINRLRDMLGELEELAKQYHTAAQHSEPEAKRIKLMLQRVSYELEYLNLLDRIDRDISMIALRKAITYHNFDSQKHVSQDLGGELMAGIYASVDAILNVHELEFRSRFRAG
jgi:hypothetical protein